MKKIYKKYPLNQSYLFKLKSIKKLSEVLGINCDSLKNGEYKNIIKYSDFTNEKGRTINNPCDQLKKIQKRLLKHFSKIETPSYLISGKKGLSYLNNAEVHALKHRYIVTSDISEFYKNCRRKYVYVMLKEKFKMAGDVAGIITDIVCYGNYIPTGSPTSQIVAYLTYSETFDKINELIQRKKCVFTLYVDDMTFSSDKYIDRKVLYQVGLELLKKGLKVKNKKTKKYSKNEISIVTGVAIDNGKLKVPNKQRYSILRHFEEYEITKDEQLYLKLKGKIQAARRIEKDIFPTLVEKLQKK